jgi:ATP-binding cassette, subfamily B, bacterial
MNTHNLIPSSLLPFQKTTNDDALKCLRTIAQHHGKMISLTSLRRQAGEDSDHHSLQNIAQIAESIGFRARCSNLRFNVLTKEVPLPCIIKWNDEGFVVVKSIVKNQVAICTDKQTVTISQDEFCKNWLPYDEGEGKVLLLEPAPNFNQAEDKTAAKNPQGLRSLLVYLKKYPKLIRQIIIGLIVGTFLKLMTPFLTQSIVDVGVMNNNYNFIYVFLAGQLMLVLGRISLESIRGWLLLHVSARVGVSLLTDFIAKVMKLPIGSFSEKMVGEVMQRVEDQKRIETFISQQLSMIAFSIANLTIFTIIFAFYDVSIFAIFLGATLLNIGWVLVFMKSRREVDLNKAKIAEAEQNSMVQLVQGMADIKFANAEMLKRWDWEKLRVKLFRQNFKTLRFSQYQQVGGMLINDAKNIIITFLSAKAVLDGNISLGAMLAIQQMLGQTNNAAEQIFLFFQQLQDARISMERINAVHQLPEEDDNDYEKCHQLPENHPIVLRNVTFQYPNSNQVALQNIKLYIPAGKTTAIVGSSGSGKSTLLKLMMKNYAPNEGEVTLGKLNLNNISTRAWRNECAVVTAEGIIFSDSILNNIALGDAEPDLEKVKHAAKVANIHTWIESTSGGYYSEIGGGSASLSQGQKQRILIARAVYKDPEFFFFDEGTSALDVQNQQVILDNLQEFYQGRTVVVVAHRLSTIYNADQIVVIEGGQILEKGTHDELIALEGRYFDLLTTQLEAAA